MKYTSTRDNSVICSGAEAVLKGLSDDGGLFVPMEIPALSAEEFKELAGMEYPARVAYVLSKFFDDYGYDELLGYAENAYGRFDGDPCPLVNIDDNIYVLELWHGPTCAFKDMALTILPHLLSGARAKTGAEKKSLIMTATSGDTGKAALEGFKDVEGTDIIVFYPSDGVSEMQKLQMTTQDGSNVRVCAVKGNFDDTQNAVKAAFGDKELTAALAEEGFEFSSANSINWGRLAPQIAYYVSAYCDVINSGKIAFGDKVNFCVPSGNFGNILAAYYASRMGVGVNRLICASNVNNVLTDFINTGVYDINREFHKTMSPSMDILISSNLERLLFELSGRDDKLTAERMRGLNKDGRYAVSKEEVAKLRETFVAGFADEDETAATIEGYMDLYDYLLDTHSAVAAFVYNTYFDETADETPTVIVSTASAFKFPCDVYEALTDTRVDDAFKASKKLRSFSGVDVPTPLEGLDEKLPRFDKTIEKSRIKDEIIDFVKTLKE